MNQQVTELATRSSEAASGPVSASVTRAPRYLWRTIRADGTVNHYGSQARRNAGARKHADTDQRPVTCERWTAERGWYADLAGTSPDRRLVEGLGWVNGSGVVEPSCQSVSGLRKLYRCGIVPVVDATGYCPGHQHVYRRVNEIPEPPRPRRPTLVENGYHTVHARLCESELCALAVGGTVTVNVRCEELHTYSETHPGAHLQEGHADFARYLGERITGHAIPGITYWEAAPGSTTYTVRFDLSPDVYVRQARRLTSGRGRHGAVKHARDQRRAALKREARGIVVDLEIENEYELYPDVTSYVHHARIPAPPCQHDEAAYNTWQYEHLHGHTGTGRPRGDSWYDGEITWASDPAMVGQRF